MCGGENRQVFSAACQFAVSAAGAGGLSVCLGDFCDVPERRCPRNAIAERPDNIGLANLDTAVQVRAIKARSLTAVVILDDISRPGCVDTILMSVVTLLYGFLAADDYGLRVGIPLSHRSGAGVEPKNSEENNDKEEHKALHSRRLLVAVSHFTTLSSPRRNACVLLQKTLLDARMACKQDEVSRHYFASVKITP